ncbi:hypothetical protein VPH35_033147 [Triticum aestivum]
MDKPNNQEGSIRNNSTPTGLLHLPIDVLRCILSRLSLKQVVRMNMLSHEWRRLGICRPDLVFNGYTFVRTKTTWYKNMDSVAMEFVTGVDNVLRLLSPPSTATTTTLDRFVVKFGLNMRYTQHIDRWIDFLTALMGKHIGIDLVGGNTSEDGKYVVPLCKLSGPDGSRVKSLYRANVCLKPPPSFRGIANLKKLSLHYVSIDAGDLQCLLLSCALLESLSLERCPLPSLSIYHELRQLQYLSVRRCAVGTIQLQAPNLTTFEFVDCLTPIALDESFKLSEATFVLRSKSFTWCCDATDYILMELPTIFPHVHKLSLHFVVFQKVHRFSKSNTTFLNLRHLNLNISIMSSPEDTSWVTRFVYLLELAPLLQELELHIKCDRFRVPSARIVTVVPGPRHRHLRSVHITGFWDLVGIAELALYILENATVLERMVVDPLAKEGLLQHKKFAEKHLSRDEFRHIITIL